nr:MAG TPA: PORTAL PROTEIN, 15 PROTEIN, HEAD PROTEIN, VIRAL INFECTION, TAILED.2A [Caudoviricetes sp.]
MEIIYDIEMAKNITGITDDALIDFLVKGTISRIERIIGYELAKCEKTEFIQGVDTNVVYLNRKPVEHISKALWRNQEVSYRQEKHRLILIAPLCQSEFLEVTYTAGYETLPFDIEMFIFSSIKESIANESGLKSFSLKDVSYSYFDKVQQSENFRRGIIDLFGVRV